MPNINNKLNTMDSSNPSISNNNLINLSAHSGHPKLSSLKPDLKVDIATPISSKDSLNITDKSQPIECRSPKYNQNKEKIHSIVSPTKNL